MLYYLIMCRLLTHAQRTAKVLEQARIATRILRAPQELSADGCGYCVKISSQIEYAVSLLGRKGLEPKKIYRQEYGGEYEEVVLS